LKSLRIPDSESTGRYTGDNRKPLARGPDFNAYKKISQDAGRMRPRRACHLRCTGHVHRLPVSDTCARDNGICDFTLIRYGPVLQLGRVVSDAKGGTWSANNLSLSSAQSEVGTGSLAFTTPTSWATGPALNLTGDFTIELWLYPTTVSGTTMMISQWDQQYTSTGAWGVSMANGVPAFSFGPYSVMGAIMSGGTISSNKWTHLAVTRQGSTFREFVNGSIVASASFSGAGLTVTVPVTIGNYIGFGGALPASGVTTFQGYMQQIRITNGVARYTAAFTPATTPDPTQ
jgi:hypothetical protein